MSHEYAGITGKTIQKRRFLAACEQEAGDAAPRQFSTSRYRSARAQSHEPAKCIQLSACLSATAFAPSVALNPFSSELE
jgi:hypothetical protein